MYVLLMMYFWRLNHGRYSGTEGKAGMAAIHVDLSGLTATGETGLGGCGDVSYPDLDNLVK